MSDIPAVWKTKMPSQWATSPEWMSFHYLTEAERCPRAVALRHSHYESIWSKRGYPDNPNIFGLIGQIVHLSIQRIVSALSNNRCTSIRDPESIRVLKELGGYSTVISSVTEAILKPFEGNPRFVRHNEQMALNLRTRMPQIREKLQVFLSRLHWTSRLQLIEPRTEAVGRTSDRWKRTPLSDGTYSEVELRDPNLKWRGLVDLLEVDGAACTITDIKTGEKSEAHKAQIMVYAILWRDDNELNPKASLPSQLVLSYPDADEVLPAPTSQDLDRLTHELRNRSNLVRMKIDTNLPEANVSEENCRGCQVRLICQEYWSPAKRPTSPPTQTNSDDIEVVLLKQLGQTTWEAECRVSSILKHSTKILIRFSSADRLIGEHFKCGIVVRLAGALLILRDAAEMPLLQITTATEPLFL